MTAADNEELLATTWHDGVQYVWLSDHSRIVTVLRARVAELQHKQEKWHEVIDANERALKLAESQLQQVKADAERIDWLEAAIRKSGDIEYADKIKNTIDDEYQRNGGDLRVAIDLARRNDGTA